MNLMERFADSSAIHNMTVMERLAGSGITALMGMGVTFFVLFFLWGCIALLARFMNRGSLGPAPAGGSGARHSFGAAYAPGAGRSVQPQPISMVGLTGNSAGRHMAVIAAAIVAYESSNSSLVVRRIMRLPGRPAWSHDITERKVCK